MRDLALAVLLCFVGCAGDAPPPPPPRPLSLLLAPDQDALHMGGTGAMTPLVTLLSEEWTRRSGRPRVLVEESIGSGGGIRAAVDGAIDLGMVSRPLSSEEQKLGLVTMKMGQDVVVLVAHPSVEVSSIATTDLPALYRGERTKQPSGHPLLPLLRDRSESANAALDRVVPGLYEAREQAYKQRRLRVLFSDRAMAEAIAGTPGSFGITSLSWLIANRLPLKVLGIDGVVPSVENANLHRYRATRELFFVARPERLSRAQPFLDFVRTPEAQALMSSYGYIPASEHRP
ncbi:MAG TPA: substrate-binding domain-containing protein [Pseudomonadota bacterium]|nr:substrate-binding domain-containing protein [Pseudomonadota bacterium]